jgi:hypothetical protein
MLLDVPAWLLVVVLSAVLLVCWLLWRGASELRHGIALWRNDPVAVMDAANVDGAVELEGTAESGGRTLQAPFTGTACLICEYEVQEYRSSNNGGHWKTLAEHHDAVPFIVEDDTGSVAVDVEGAEFPLDVDAKIESGKDETPPKSIQRFLDGIGVDREEGGVSSFGPISIKRGDRRRYIERRLDLGDAVHVYGQTRYGRTVGDVSGTVNAVVGAGGATPLFEISEGGERAAIRNNLVTGAKYLLVGGTLAAIVALIIGSAL